jgi:hypothetical protein
MKSGKKRGGARPGAGQPKTEFDLEQVEKMAMLQSTEEEIGWNAGVTRQTVARHKNDPAFAEAMERGKAKGRMSIRRMIMISAQQGNIAAQIFLCKTVLNMKETLTIEDKRVPAAIRYGWVAEAPKQIEKAETEPITAEFVDIDDHKVQ